jgi:MoaA/NifB/PqqE/SkfB family radical SAM enzyme
MRSDFPSHIQIQTTSACGAACTICPHPVESPKWSNKLMSDELFASIVNQLVGKPVEYLCPYLMADPMSDRRIFARIQMLRDALPATHIEVSTTGLYLMPANAEKLLAAPLSELRISCHGTTSAEWSTTMPGLRHEKHWPNVTRFIDMWRETKPYPLRIVTLNDMWSRERERDIKNYWADQSIDTVSWSVITRAEQVDLTVFGKDKHKRSSMRERKRCRFGRDTHWLHILSDGRATLCCMDYKQEAITGTLTPGAFSIEQLWRSDEFEGMRAKVRGDATADDDFICQRCEWHVSADEAVQLESAYVAEDAHAQTAGVFRR